MSPASVLAFLTLLVAVPLLAYATWSLWALVRRYHNPVTRAHAIAVTVVLVHAFVFGWIFVNNDRLVPWLDTGATKIITRLIEFGGGTVVALTVLLLLLPLPGRKR